MAGIGFELRRMLDERKGFFAKVRAYASAGLISSGPWLMTILTLTLLNVASPFLGAKEGVSMFRSLVTYAFAFSLIIQGIGQMAITRWIADILYARQYTRVLPAFAATLGMAGLVHVVIGTVFCTLAQFPLLLSCLSIMLFAIIGMAWIALTWLSVAREYDEVLRAYIYGTVLALGGLALLSIRADSVGVLGAYTVGQAFTLVRLIGVIVRGMEAGGKRELRVFASLRIFPRLVALGLIYNSAIWVDKMVFWFRDGTGAHPWVRYHPLYDTCSFLAYLTVVPALAVNLVRLETSFYEFYRAYYGAILGGSPLAVIEDKRRRMFENLQEGAIRLLRVQGFITVAVILFAPPLIDFLELPPAAIRVFRLTALGALFHVLLLLTMLMQLYFDLRAQALATSIVFFILNGSLAWWSVDRGISSYGIGYAIASFLSLLLGYTLLHRSLERLDHLTFTNQKIGDQSKEDLPSMLEQPREVEHESEEEPVRAPERIVVVPEPEPTPEPEPESEPEPQPAREAGEDTLTEWVDAPPLPARPAPRVRVETVPLPQQPEEETLTEEAGIDAPPRDEPERVILYPDPPEDPSPAQAPPRVLRYPDQDPEEADSETETDVEPEPSDEPA